MENKYPENKKLQFNTTKASDEDIDMDIIEDVINQIERRQEYQRRTER